MVRVTLEEINTEIQKYASLAEEVGDIRIEEHSSREENSKLFSNNLVFEEENVYMYLKFDTKSEKKRCVFYITEIDPEYVANLMDRIGLVTTEENIENYGRDPTMIEKYWNDRFIKKYKEVLKHLRKKKIPYLFLERFTPTLNKTRNNELVM